NKIQNLKVVSNCKILSVNGSMKFGSIKADVDGKTQDFEASALFVSLGRKAGTSILQENINLDEKGFVVVDDNMRTSVDGVYAIGDVRNGHLKQIVTACSDGAIAGNDC
ncbi:MAG: FAD-dependent oxidoreductase, partial [Clostridia bacterium]|nr:FAD-dependent oxidoreductase [Clostridia bacterium]